MFLPESFNTIECEPITCEVVNNRKELLQRLLVCGEAGFSGYLTLTLPGNPAQVWNLYFLNGGLAGGTSQGHAVRRWHRQVSRYCAQLSAELRSFTQQPAGRAGVAWDYASLAQQVEGNRLSRSQFVSVVRGNLIEILFDFIQAHQATDRPSPIRIAYHDLPQSLKASPVLIQPGPVFQQAMHAWTAWSQAGLSKFSPDLAPVIRNGEALRQQTSASAYRNLTQSIDGDRTCRDLAIKLKQHLILLVRSLLPYMTQKVIGLQVVADKPYPTPMTTAATVAELPLQPTGPLVAYLEDSRFDSMAMGQILQEAGYRFISIRDPVEALPMLLEHKPELIFLDVLMPVLSGYEVCAQIRQISTFKQTPIIFVTSSDGIVDRVRAKLVGSTAFLAKPISSEKVLATLQRYRPLAPAASPRSRQPISQNLSPGIAAWPSQL